MTKKKIRQAPETPISFNQARDEMFSHILRCGVLEAAVEHQKDWFDDTMQYLTERYNDLSPEELTQLRTLGERYCRPVQPRANETVGAGIQE
ncbi:MAG: hypothetical protein ABI613_05570 [Gemmatimonadota bacterium]